MARLYHSASSIELGRACEYAWALRYIEGWREPTVTWDEIEMGAPHESRQRSLALGTGMHGVGEAWLERRDPPYAWSSLPGEMFAEGRHHLPDPEVTRYEVERPIGTVLLPIDSPPTAIEIHGVMFAGFVDARAFDIPADERDRLGIDSDFLTIDHKSCANIPRYAKRASDLVVDVAANVYGIDTCERLGVPVSPQRWVYYESKERRRSAAVDFTIEHPRALDVLAEPAELAKRLDQLTCLSDAEKNPAACGDYGGRPCHFSRGGPCHPPRQSVGKKLAQLRVRKQTPKDGIKMEKASFAKKFGNAKANVEKATTETPAETPPKRTRKPRPAKSGKTKPAAKLPKDSTAAKVSELSAQLVAEEIDLAAASEELKTAEDALESAKAAAGAANERYSATRDALREALS